MYPKDTKRHAYCIKMYLPPHKRQSNHRRDTVPNSNTTTIIPPQNVDTSTSDTSLNIQSDDIKSKTSEQRHQDFSKWIHTITPLLIQVSYSHSSHKCDRHKFTAWLRFYKSSLDDMYNIVLKFLGKQSPSYSSFCKCVYQSTEPTCRDIFKYKPYTDE